MKRKNQINVDGFGCTYVRGGGGGRPDGRMRVCVRACVVNIFEPIFVGTRYLDT